MKTLLGKTVCFLLRAHKWRRLRKAECVTDQGTPLMPDDVPHLRICARCGVMREVKTRKAAMNKEPTK